MPINKMAINKMPIDKRVILGWVLLAATSLIAASCSDSAPDWRAELIDLSKSEHAEALYYTEPLDDSNVEPTMRDQCSNLGSVLKDDGANSPITMYQITASLSSQIEAGVPVEVLEQDLTALERGMAELCPIAHGWAVDYFGFDDFARLATCNLVADPVPGAFCEV